MSDNPNSINQWEFSVSDGELQATPPAGMNPGLVTALLDLTTSNIGSSIGALRMHRDMWEGAVAHPGDSQYGIFNNDMSITLDRTEAVLEGSYDQYPTVRMPQVDFEDFLNQYERFLTVHGHE
jgi:hypothetical protein